MEIEKDIKKDIDDLCGLMVDVSVKDISEKNKKIINNDFNMIIMHYIYNGNVDFALTCNYDSIFRENDYKSVMNYLDNEGYKVFCKILNEYCVLNNIIINEMDRLTIYDTYVEIIDDGFGMMDFE